ncbi:hypothetical protein ACFQE1_04335 [Halobium palmae]|uniref:Uncharacterized protein n=1 Tax=Halobium palmae TaxID=1776492 RepID=A0ABD5RX82_9EURY
MSELDIRVPARTAELRASDDGDDDGTWRFSGVAVGEGDILYMDDGTPILFTAEELAKAADTQAGEPLSVDHPTDDNGNAIYPPPTDETVGTVAKAGHVPGKGLAYEATTHDKSIADGVKGGTYHVSVHPKFTQGPKDSETGAYIAENIRFQDLSVVSKGMSPSNTAEWGPSQVLASYTHQHDIGAELSAAADGSGDDAEAGGRSFARGFINEFRKLAGGGADPESGGESTESESTGSDSDADSEGDEEGGEDDDSDADADDPSNMGDTPDDPEGGDAGGDNGDGTDNGDNGADVLEIDTGDHDSFDDLLEARLESAADEVTASAKKADLVDEIIAESSGDGYTEDDREELLASSAKVIRNEHQRITGTSAATIRANAGGRQYSRRESDTDEDDPSAYGVGVEN